MARATATHDGPDDWAIDVAGVTKHYRSLGRRLFRKAGVEALRGVDLRVARGEVFGLLGPNGAGKSTLVKILLGLVRPTTLSGRVLGRPVGSQDARRHVGYLPEQHRLPPYLTGRQVVRFFANLGGVPRREASRRADELVDRVGLTPAADRKVSGYSKGMRQRIGLAQALAADPRLVILDEPTDGVDPVARRQIRDILAALRDDGVCVFVNSHLLSDLELLCDRVAILVAGRVVRSGTLSELSAGWERYEIELADPAGPDALARTFDVSWHGGPSLPSSPGAAGPALPLHATWDGVGVRTDPAGRLLYLATADVAAGQRALDVLRAADLPVRRFVPVRPTLEELFVSSVSQTGPSQS